MTRRYVSGLRTLAATIAMASVVAGQAFAMELTLPGEPEIDHRDDAACEVAAPPFEQLARGRIVSVDSASKRITLEFQPIPTLLPEGGTRIFRVNDAASLKGLGPGDKVRFEVERDGRSYTVTRIENSN